MGLVSTSLSCPDWEELTSWQVNAADDSGQWLEETSDQSSAALSDWEERCHLFFIVHTPLGLLMTHGGIEGKGWAIGLVVSMPALYFPAA